MQEKGQVTGVGILAFREFAAGENWPAAASSAAPGLPDSEAPPLSIRARLRAGANPAPFMRLAGACRRALLHSHDWIETRWEQWDPVHDLAEDIGSARWVRGMGTMLGLSILALSFWPDFSEVEAATTGTGDRSVRDEYRAQMILPLAFGGESGSRMGPTAAVVPIAHAPERPRISMTTTLGEGDSFGRMLQRAGVGADDAGRVAALVSGAVPLSGIGPGTRFDLTLGRREAAGTPRPLEKLAFRARFDLALSIERRGDSLVLGRQAIAVDSTPLRLTGTVGPGLYRSARAAGVPIKAIQDYLQALDSHVDLESGVAPGDRFDIVVGYRRSAMGESEVGDLIYAGLERGGTPKVQLLRWGAGGEGGGGQFVDAANIGMQQASTRLFAPVNGRMTSPFGMRRHPILGYVRMHSGMDFGAPWGAPIHAVSSGTVAFAGRHGGHGNYVRLEHGGGIGTGYAHMSRIAVAPGTMVQAGQVIGYVGSSGLSTGPHLHYELYKNGQTVNPAAVTFLAQPAIDAKQIAAVKARLAAIKAIPVGRAFQTKASRQVAVLSAAAAGK